MTENRIFELEKTCINLGIISKHKKIADIPYNELKNYYDWLKLAIFSNRKMNAK